MKGNPMKTEHKIITASFLLGAFVWFIDATIDFLVFSEETFWGALLGSGTDQYMRLLILLLFVASGIFIAHAFTRNKQVKGEIQRLNSAIEQAGDGIAISNTEGGIIYANRAYAQMHGYLPDEVVGIPQRRLNSRIVTEKYRNLSLGDILNKDSDAPAELEVEHVRKDGTFSPLRYRFLTLKMNRGYLQGY